MVQRFRAEDSGSCRLKLAHCKSQGSSLTGHLATTRCPPSVQQETHAPQQIVKLFDYHVSAGEQRWRDSEAKGLGGIEVDDQLKLCRLLGWQIGRVRTL